MALYSKEDLRLPAAELSDLENLRQFLKDGIRVGFWEPDNAPEARALERELERWLELLDKIEKIVR